MIPTASLMRTGRGEQLWRPLHNPRDLQVSAFADTNPRGFGLMQRDTRLRRLRGSGSRATSAARACGSSRSATGARARCSWSRSRPTARSTTTSSPSGGRRSRCRRESEYSYAYRLHWVRDGAGEPALAQIRRARAPARAPAPRRPAVRDRLGRRRAGRPAGGARHRGGGQSASAGKIRNAVAQPQSGDRRLAADVRAGRRVMRRRSNCGRSCCAGDEPLTETWIYRWTRLSAATAGAPLARPAGRKRRSRCRCSRCGERHRATGRGPASTPAGMVLARAWR